MRRRRSKQLSCESLRQKDPCLTRLWRVFLLLETTKGESLYRSNFQVPGQRTLSIYGVSLSFFVCCIKKGGKLMSNLKQTPLYPIYKEWGAKTIDFGGWELPVQFSRIKEEHEAVRRNGWPF